jgi:hypothetical protein
VSADSSIDWAQLSSLLPEDGDRIHSPKLLKKNTMDNVQKLNNSINILSSPALDLTYVKSGGLSFVNNNRPMDVKRLNESARDAYTKKISLTEKGKKGNAIPVTGRGDPWGCETSRIPHFLENRLTDGGAVVSLTLRPSSPPPPRKIRGTHFC